LTSKKGGGKFEKPKAKGRLKRNAAMKSRACHFYLVRTKNGREEEKGDDLGPT